ncbi:MAG: transcription antitermination factor NusB [Candidatus Omnitrophica bacterium]|nr:transcription antitermination factor NusB [Candidatus Omnitrophota bacterium]
MRKRTYARELALMALYQTDITKAPVEESLQIFWETHKVVAEVKEFATSLTVGTTENLKRIDEVISHYADNWELSRMAAVDRNILRLATYELLFLEEIPPKVSLNEAIDLAKKYGDQESGRFVNGILDQIGKMEKGLAEKTKNHTPKR